MSVKYQWHYQDIKRWLTNIYWLIVDRYINWLSNNHWPRCQPPYQLLQQPLYQPNSTYCTHDLIFLQEKFWLQSRIGSRPLWNDCEMFIIICSVEAKNWKNYTLGCLRHKEKIIMGTNKLFVSEEILLSFEYDAPNHP